MDDNNEMSIFGNSQHSRVVAGLVRDGDREELLGDMDFMIGDANNYNKPPSNNKGASNIPNNTNKKKKNKFYRHTKEQIRILQAIFDRNSHPDEKQMKELSLQLNMKRSQIKFWFQNRRTHLKVQTDRHENVLLREENDRLRIENTTLVEKMANLVCSVCGGDDNKTLLLLSLERSKHELHEKNACLREELNRLRAHYEKIINQNVNNTTTANVSSSTLAGFGGPSSTLPTPILPQTFPSQAPTNFMLCDPSTDPWLGGGRVRGKSRSAE